MNIASIFNHILSPDRVITADLQKRYGASTVGGHTVITGALKPTTSEEIQSIIKIARKNNLKLYPISTGKNWGYSDSRPITDNNVIIDLSLMNNIIDYSPDFSYVTVQPGVTQKKLADFLQNNGDLHMISPTGSSPDASIVGNYLERGYGIAPPIDHAMAVTSLKAILADGSLYESILARKECTLIDKLYTNGIGPYTDGLFFQSSMGIVTEITIKLALKPDAASLIIADTNQKNIAKIINQLRNIRQKWDMPSLSIKICNDLYTIAASKLPYPSEYLDKNEALPENIIEAICKKKTFYDTPLSSH